PLERRRERYHAHRDRQVLQLAKDLPGVRYVPRHHAVLLDVLDDHRVRDDELTDHVDQRIETVHPDPDPGAAAAPPPAVPAVTAVGGAVVGTAAVVPARAAVAIAVDTSGAAADDADRVGVVARGENAAALADTAMVVSLSGFTGVDDVEAGEFRGDGAALDGVRAVAGALELAEQDVVVRRDRNAPALERVLDRGDERAEDVDGPERECGRRAAGAQLRVADPAEERLRPVRELRHLVEVQEARCALDRVERAEDGVAGFGIVRIGLEPEEGR